MNADNSIATKYKKIEKPVGEGTYGVRARSFFSSSLFILRSLSSCMLLVLAITFCFRSGFFYFIIIKVFFPSGGLQKKE